MSSVHLSYQFTVLGLSTEQVKIFETECKAQALKGFKKQKDKRKERISKLCFKTNKIICLHF